MRVFFYFVLFIFITPLTNAQIDKSRLLKIIIELDEAGIISDADKYLKEEPVTITSFTSARSAGGIHDYYSEGDYWWPDPGNPDGPYIRKDGLTNPDNFTAHRNAMRKLSLQVPALVAAFKLTNDKQYAEHAVRHLNAWFIDENTMMYPHLKFAQAIKGRATGRGIGIIDAIHLVEVVQAAIVLEKAGMIDPEKLKLLKKWFTSFSDWLVNDQYGIDEKNNGNNHSTCWNMQVAEYSKFTNDREKFELCKNHFKNELLPEQMLKDGSFPLELERTKPYAYSLFNLDAMIMTAEILSDPEENLYEFSSTGGKNLKSAMEFMYPYIMDKSLWPYKKDVMYFESFPVRHPSLLFSAIAYNEVKYFEVWKELDSSPDEDEVLRNFFIRQPVLWIY